jgi:cyclopropane fatty-acyl-phospholipid synthase-like methyltransferase
MLFCMNKDTKPAEAEYRRLASQLAKTKWISHGYVQNRGPGAGGPCYQWTRKVRGKTVSVALSKEQYLWMKKAIANRQKAQALLLRMEQMSRTIMFQTLPDTRRRKPLSKNVMGIN